MPNSDGKTTLSVDKGFAQMLRQQFEGRNDMERLENWADQQEQSQESYNNVIDADDLADKLAEKLDVSSEVEKALPSGAFR